ncbi:MAG: T9SS C-terminal target domain-containing protein, partial [Bacteroidetes bacterium]
RLKQVDVNGKFTYHPVVTLAGDDSQITLVANAYPNPFNQELLFNVTAAEAGDLSIRVVDIQGRLVSEQITPINAGQSTVTLQGAETISAGAYFVELRLNNFVLRQKLVKSSQ